MKTNRLISITLVAIMALTVISGAGVMTATKAAALPTSNEIATALDCTELGWTFVPSLGVFTEGGYVSISAGPGHGMAQVQTTALASGQVTFSWNLAIVNFGEASIQFLVGDKEVATLTTEPGVWSTVGPITVTEGQVLTWRGTAFSDIDPIYAAFDLDSLQFLPPITKDSVLNNLAALRTTVNSIPWYAFFPGTKYVLLDAINTATWQTKLGIYGAAAYTLQTKVVTRTDGCVLRGHPDITDYVRTCNAQKQLYGQATDTVADLKWLQSNPP
jgi:hypothetical protein